MINQRTPSLIAQQKAIIPSFEDAASNNEWRRAKNVFKDLTSVVGESTRLIHIPPSKRLMGKVEPGAIAIS